MADASGRTPADTLTHTAVVLRLMDRLRHEPALSFDNPDDIYYGATFCLAELIVADHKRFTDKERHNIIGAGAIILRHLSQISGFDTLDALLAARVADLESRQ